MGAFITQISFKMAKPQDIARAIREQLPTRRCFVTLTDRKWVTVFPELSDEDAREFSILALGKRVCRACRCCAIGFHVVDSDVFYWWTFDDTGSLVGCSSTKDEDEEMSEDEQIGLSGDLTRIAALGSERGLTAQKVHEILSLGNPGTLEVSISRLGELLGIQYANLTYGDIVDCVHTPQHIKDLTSYDWTQEFIFVGDDLPVNSWPEQR